MLDWRVRYTLGREEGTCRAGNWQSIGRRPAGRILLLFGFPGLQTGVRDWILPSWIG